MKNGGESMRMKITQELIEKMKALYDSGMSTADIAEQIGCGTATVHRKLVEAGYDLKKRDRDKLLEKYLIGEQMFLKGASTVKVAEDLHIGRIQFVRWMKEKGYTIENSSKKHSYDSNYFKKIDTEEKAYWLGILYADGSITEYFRNGKLKSMRVEITLKNEDRGHLLKLKDALKSTTPIEDKKVVLNGKEHLACRLVINSTEMCRDLIKLGCTPRKSQTKTFPTQEIVPDEFIIPFMRGYFDGNGSIMWHTNKKWGRVNVTSNRQFLEGMVARMKWKEINLKQANKGSDKAFMYETAVKKDSTFIINQLYSNANIYLDRKYNKYKEIIAVLEGDL